jgi:pentatricopeptide repeat protein
MNKSEESLASNNTGPLTFETLKNLSQVPRPLQIVHLLQQDLPYLIRANAPEEHVIFAFERLAEIDCATIYSYTMVISYLAKRNRADLAWKYWTLLKEQKGTLYTNTSILIILLYQEFGHAAKYKINFIFERMRFNAPI